jgi:hypothetical protein
VHVDTLDAALDAAAALIGSVPAAGGQRRTFELRARGVGGEAWEPAIVVSAAPDVDGTIDREVLGKTEIVFRKNGFDQVLKVDGLTQTLGPRMLTLPGA